MACPLPSPDDRAATRYPAPPSRITALRPFMDAPARPGPLASGTGVAEPDLSTGLVFLLALGAGLGAASVYYSHPLLPQLQQSLGASVQATGLVPTLVQLGYAAGILLLAPLGDRYDRRLIITAKAVLLTLGLIGTALSTGIVAMYAACLFTGVMATLAQDAVPAAATLAPEAKRGRVVGTVMTGLFLGVLLSRVASGAIAARFGWPAVFWTAAGVVALFAVAAWRGLPSIVPTTRLGYLALLRSLASLWAAHPAMRRAAFAQALLSVAFSAFWSTLAVMLHDQFGLGPAVAGAFGLAGAVGAMAASLAGRWADRHGPEWVTRLGAGLATAFFALQLFDALLPGMPWRIGLLIVGTLGFDFGIQASLVGHQTLMYGLDPAARSRLNALLLTSMFIGMAAGSALASALLAQFGWMGVMGLATVASAGALASRLTAPR